MSTEDRFRDSSGKRECFISMVVSLLDVTTATQQFTVSGYVNAIWQVIPDFEQQEATNKIYPTKKMTEDYVMCGSIDESPKSWTLDLMFGFKALERRPVQGQLLTLGTILGSLERSRRESTEVKLRFPEVRR